MSTRTPRLNEESVRAILTANNVSQDHLAVVAVRGYYLDSMGREGENDRRIWDDAMFVVTPRGCMSYQANTDPNGYRKGYGFGSKKGMACLKEGIHLYGTGLHKGRKAFRQCEPFTVIRDGNPPYSHKGYHAINLHSGGYNSTSSLGCQTLPKSTWPEFRDLVYRGLSEFDNPRKKNDWKQNVRCFPYVLIHEKDRANGDLVVSRRYLS